MPPSEPNDPRLTDADLRAMGHWAADCAERVLPLFEAVAPDDARPRQAIAGIRAYAAGEPRTAALRALAWAALAAAREVGDPAAEAAARSAAYAAATAFTHSLATPHQTWHLLSPAVWQALARERAAGGDPAVGDAEIAWAGARATPGVSEIARRMPAARPGRGRVGVLARRLDADLRR